MNVASVAAIVWVALAGFAPVAFADDMHIATTPSDVKWGPGPKVLPAGAQAAVLYGDPTKEGLFVLRLKFPAGYAVPPHTHPVPEVVTVISGAGKMGMGEAADRSSTTTLPAGSFFALPPGMAHFVYYDEETVVQITTNGPWGLKYINPKDDPRNAK